MDCTDADFKIRVCTNKFALLKEEELAMGIRRKSLRVVREKCAQEA